MLSKPRRCRFQCLLCVAHIFLHFSDFYLFGFAIIARCSLFLRCNLIYSTCCMLIANFYKFFTTHLQFILLAL